MKLWNRLRLVLINRFDISSKSYSVDANSMQKLLTRFPRYNSDLQIEVRNVFNYINNFFKLGGKSAPLITSPSSGMCKRQVLD